ncbi:DNA cytosine methyltransferase [Pararhizobium sp. O133]|uniref:DNA cytosine methyltransferase n=1 Tax=Pararhizobium sp. O133 TaxID=3449278 RepID=UPI003F689026
MNTTAATLTQARKNIIKLRKAVTEKAMKLAAEVGALEAELGADEVRQFLVSRCSLSKQEISTYSKISRNVGEYHEVFLERQVPYDLVKGLANSKETVRQLALAEIISGETFGTAELTRLRKSVASSYRSQSEMIASGRQRLLIKNARINATAKAKAFRDETVALIEEVAALPPQPAKARGHKQRIVAVAQRAQTVLSSFEAIYGSEHVRFGEPEWRTAKMFGRSAANTHRTLQALSAPCRHKKSTLPDHATRILARRDGMVRNLADFIGSQAHLSFAYGEHEPAKTLPKKRLKALELCAGAGGMALGLEAAGFDHVALVEFNKDAAATMRLNRPDWPVVEQDLTTLDFTPYAGKVDLVCGGLPCQPYSEEGNGAGKNDTRDLLLEGARVVREIKPRAFLFENVRGALFGKHADQISAFLKELGQCGYEIRIAEVNTQQFGIAQNRPRILFIGMRERESRDFRTPEGYPDRRANVGDTLYDLMAANGWSDVDDWAEYCRTVTFELADGTVVEGAQASTLTGRKGKAQEREGIRWAKNGLNPAGVPVAAPTDELVRKAGPDFVPGLTLRMRARLQDFKDDYEFVGGKESVAKQIGNAVAPRLAQAIGLALYEVLESISFDVEAMLWPKPEDERASERQSVDAPSLELFLGPGQKLARNPEEPRVSHVHSPA